MVETETDLRKCKKEFLLSVRRYRLVSLFIFVLGGSAMLTILACLIPFRVQLDNFFDKRVGGDLGDGLRGLSVALIASPPMIAAIYWQMRRSKLVEERCSNCSTSFAGAGFAEAVVRENKCPKCDSIVFSSNDNVPDGHSIG